MNKLHETTAKRIFRSEWAHLTPHEREVIEGVLHRINAPRDPNKEFLDARTLGQRSADRIATFGGSWTFIFFSPRGSSSGFVLNTEILAPDKKAFDPYPYIFLNLILSTLAAIQAPIIMMSQNRQAARDRRQAEEDREVNLRVELAIRDLKEHLHAVERRLIDITSVIDLQSSGTGSEVE